MKITRFLRFCGKIYGSTLLRITINLTVES